ncbi:MAG: cadherin repeat domain-containing protein [Planctomycetes bacterium]|nr:cadherin repeat domain-containing protein [Planctomycetota bacterium]
MTQRERLLVAVVGVLILLGGTMYGFRYITKNISAKRSQIASLENQIQDKQLTLQVSRLAADRMRLYERRSLPADVEKARSLYQTWLLKSVTGVGFDEPDVNVVSSQSSNRNLYHQLGFTLSGRGDLKQLVEFLHAFYQADYMHRIRRLHVKRIQGTKKLDISMAIEALSLPTATHLDGLSEFDSGRLAHGGLEEYLDKILARNLSGPPNHEPMVDSIGETRASTGSTVSIKLRARDPDRLDQLRYAMEAENLPGAQLDSRSGEFRWRPDKPGDYQVVFKVTDDGLPPKTQSQRVRITVTDPPPERPREPVVSKPSFDLARFAYVTAITETSGQREAWINLRTEAKTLRVREGDEFTIGEVPVTVKQIGTATIELEAPVLERRFRVALGRSLAEGSDLAYQAASG